MRVLVIEGPEVRKGEVEKTLKAEGMQVFVESTGFDGVDLAEMFEFDAVVLPENASDVSLEECLRGFRRRVGHGLPIIVILDANRRDGAAYALSKGADDAIQVATQCDEIALRIKAIRRRIGGLATPRVQFGNLCVDMHEKVVRVDGEVAGLTYKQYQVIEVLALRRGRTLDRNTIMDLLYTGEDDPDQKIVDVYICLIRRRLRALGADVNIQTVRGRGYLLPDCDRAGGAPTARDPAELDATPA